MIDIETEEEEKKLKLVWNNPHKATGGGFFPGSPDWLSPLAEGTEFLCGRREMIYLMHFEVICKTNGGKIRLALRGDDNLTYHWVDPNDFCNLLDLKEVL